MAWGPTESLPLKKMTLKLAMILVLANATCSRSSELHALNTERMTTGSNGVTVSITALTKERKRHFVSPKA